jgi:hypothetical protein
MIDDDSFSKTSFWCRCNEIVAFVLVPMFYLPEEDYTTRKYYEALVKKTNVFCCFGFIIYK